MVPQTLGPTQTHERRVKLGKGVPRERHNKGYTREHGGVEGGGNAGNRKHWNLSTIPLCNNIPCNTPYGSSFVHGKMGTNDPIKKIELSPLNVCEIKILTGSYIKN